MTLSGIPVSAPTFPVELTAYEMRALANTASLLAEAFGAPEHRLTIPAGHSIPPLQSAELKLELALVLAGEER